MKQFTLLTIILIYNFIFLNSSNAFYYNDKNKDHNIKSKNNTIFVGKKQKYNSIQSAIRDSDENDIIIVEDGLYRENLKIEKSLTIKSLNGYFNTTISSKIKNKPAISIAANKVHIEGFTIYGSKGIESSGILLNSSADFCVIRSNRFGLNYNKANFYNIKLLSSKYNLIFNNISNFAHRDGIFLKQSNYNNIVKNHSIENYKTGISLYDSSDNILTENTVSLNNEFGIYLNYNSSKNNIFFNNLSNNKISNICSKALNFFNSRFVLNYLYNGNMFDCFLGNFYKLNQLIDSYHKGLTDNFYKNSNGYVYDEYPLVRPIDNYKTKLYSLNSSGSYNKQADIFLSSIKILPARSCILNILCNLNESNKNDIWTGQLCLKNPLLKNHNFIIEPGFIKDEIFFPAGDRSVISGDDNTRLFVFKIKYDDQLKNDDFIHSIRIKNLSGKSNLEIITGLNSSMISYISSLNINFNILDVGLGNIYRSIESAVKNAKNGDTIIVNDGIYRENLVIKKQLKILSENGFNKTTIIAKDKSKAVFDIYSNNVSISGFLLYGSTDYGNSAIMINQGINGCHISDNQCGLNLEKNNYYGICIKDSYLNNIYSNICNFNEKDGIFIRNCFKNTIDSNICQKNQANGIYLSNSQNNIFTENILIANEKCGLLMFGNVTDNFFYLNNFIKNKNHNIKANGENIFHSSTQFYYQFNENQNFYRGFIGNYYDDNKSPDTYRNGTTESPYLINIKGLIDEYAIFKNSEYFNKNFFQLSGKNLLLFNKNGGFPSKIILKSQKANIWSFKSNINYNINKLQHTGIWTGQIVFSDILKKDDIIIIESGYLTEDLEFYPCTDKKIIKGNNDQYAFQFLTSTLKKEIPHDSMFSIRITNNSNQDYKIISGGKWSYMTPLYTKEIDENIHYVGPLSKYRSIETAYKESKDGDKIIVKDGVYHLNLDINKSITIESENGYTKTQIIAKNSGDHVFKLMTDHIQIKGFMITGADFYHKSGIYINQDASDCKIYDNYIGNVNEKNNFYGIYLDSTNNNFIFNNKIISCHQNAVFLKNSVNNIIKDNILVNNNSHALFLNNSVKNEIFENQINNNNNNGIYLLKSSQNKIYNNEIISNNKKGIYLLSSINNNIYANIIKFNNDLALFISGTSNENIFYLNDFVHKNSMDIYSRGINKWLSSKKISYYYNDAGYKSYLGNYYVSANKKDNNGDGIADKTYDLCFLEPDDKYPLANTKDNFIINNKIKNMVKKKINNNKSLLVKNINNKDKLLKKDNFNINYKNQNIDINKSSLITNNNNILKKNNIISNTSLNKGHPEIIFTNVPPYGNRLQKLNGYVINIDPDKSYIAVYIMENGWKLRPYYDKPYTVINKDKSFSCDITTKAYDHNATEIAAFVFNHDFKPFILKDEKAITKQIYDNSIAYKTIKRFQKKPVIELSVIPNYGHRFQNLKGRALNINSSSHYIAVFIFTSKWELKPGFDNPKTTIAKNGYWECDITKKAFDWNSSKISTFLFSDDYIIPAVNSSKILPHELYEKSKANVDVFRSKGSSP